MDLVLNHRLVETGFGSKKDYTVYLKDYMKKVVKYLEENDRAGEVDDFKKNIAGKMKELLGKFKDLQFFTGRTQTRLTLLILTISFDFAGESMEADAMILMVEYKDYEGEERPCIMAFKHGLLEEKC